MSTAPRNCSAKVRRELSVCDFAEGGERATQPWLAEGCLWSRESDVSMNDFSAFLDGRRHKTPSSSVLLLINTSRAPVLPAFSQAQSASFLTSFQRVLKVSGFDCMTAAAHDLILVNPCKSEGDGKCQSVVDKP